MRTPVCPPDLTRWDALAIDVCAKFPRAWTTFCRFTFERLDAGHNRVGAKWVWEKMREEAQVVARVKGEQWALTNNLTASFVRIFEATYPEITAFETRKRPTEKRAA